MSEKTLPEVGSRWRCVEPVGLMAPGTEVEVLLIDQVGDVLMRCERREWSRTASDFLNGSFVPADAPAPEPAAAKWVPKVGDRAMLVGRVTHTGHAIAFQADGGQARWLTHGEVLRPEAAPAAPGGIAETQCIVDREPMTALARFVGKSGFSDAATEALARLKAATVEDADVRGLKSELADVNTERDRMLIELQYANEHIVSLTRELAAVRKERDEWRSRYRRREGL